MARGRTRRKRRGRGRGAPLPIDSRAQRESGEIGNEAADTRAAIAARYAAAQNALGFGTGGANPYGQRQENQRRLAIDERGVLTGAGNSLYSGSTLNRASQARRAFSKAETATEQAIGEAQNDYTRGMASTKRDEQMGDAAIREGAVKRAQAAEPAPRAVRGGPPRARRGRGRVTAPPRPTARRQRGRLY